MISAFGISHDGEIAKSLKPAHVASLQRVKDAGPFPQGKDKWNQHNWAGDRLSLHGMAARNAKLGYQGPLPMMTGHHKKFMGKATRTRRQVRDKNRKPIFGEPNVTKAMLPGGVFKPAKLLTSTERTAVRGRVQNERTTVAYHGRKPKLPERGYAAQGSHVGGGRSIAGHLAASERKLPKGKNVQVNWHPVTSPKAKTQTTDSVNRTAGGRAIINGRGGGRVEMFGTPGGSTRGTKNADILTHEMRHIGPKRNPVRFRERTQDPFRRGREEGRADFGIKRGEPYPGSPEFRRGYEDVQGRMAAAKKRRQR